MNDLWLATDHGVVRVRRTADGWAAHRPTLADRPATSIYAHAGLVFAGRTDGIWVTADQGHSWTRAAELDQPHVRWLQPHPDEPHLLFAGTEPAALYQAHDGGQTWRADPTVPALREELGWFLPYSPAAGCVRGFAFHGQRGYAAVEVGGLLRSDDRGRSWRLAAGSSGVPRFGRPPAGQIHPDVHDVVVAPDDPDRVYAPTGGGVYGSRDGGATWTRILACSYARALWVDPAKPRRLVAGPAGGVGREGSISESLDGGDSWQPADDGLATPWPRTMVERFVAVGEDLLAILDDGTLRRAPRASLRWSPALTEIAGVRAAWATG